MELRNYVRLSDTKTKDIEEAQILLDNTENETDLNVIFKNIRDYKNDMEKTTGSENGF